mgnify:CR=1 FL=1
MTPLELAYLAPLLLLALTVVVAMLLISFARQHLSVAAVTGMGLAGAFVSSAWHITRPAQKIGFLLMLDASAYFYIAVLCAISLFITLLAYDYFRERQRDPEEFYLLLVLATIGCATLVSASHFAALFLGLETLSISLYAMIGYTYRRERSIEAGIKYLVLAAVSSAFLAFGMALIYARTGRLDFAAFGSVRAQGPWILSVIGFGMMLVGIGYKLAVVPFHFWTPDVYEGSPAPATAFIATASKLAIVGLVLRMLSQMNAPLSHGLFVTLAAISIASMLLGNVLALLQTNVKRILAYSSIGQLGYVLVAFLTARAMATTAATYYIVAYALTTLGAFGVVSVLSTPENEAEEIADLNGLAWRRPGLAAVMCAMMFSLAGIPLTAGFIGKFYVVAAGAQSALWAVLIVLAISSTIGVFYYLRIVLAMFSADEKRMELRSISMGAVLALLAVAALVIFFGAYPAPLISMLRGFMQ